MGSAPDLHALSLFKRNDKTEEEAGQAVQAYNASYLVAGGMQCASSRPAWSTK